MLLEQEPMQPTKLNNATMSLYFCFKSEDLQTTWVLEMFTMFKEVPRSAVP